MSSVYEYESYEFTRRESRPEELAYNDAVRLAREVERLQEEKESAHRLADDYEMELLTCIERLRAVGRVAGCIVHPHKDFKHAYDFQCEMCESWALLQPGDLGEER